jgi:hypothetical protein
MDMSSRTSLCKGVAHARQKAITIWSNSRIIIAK